MFAHLRENGADVEMDLAWVRKFETLINGDLVRGIEASVFEIECLLQIAKSIPQLACLAEETSIIVVGNGAKAVIILSKKLGLFKQVLAQLEVLLLEVSHR